MNPAKKYWERLRRLRKKRRARRLRRKRRKARENKWKRENRRFKKEEKKRGNRRRRRQNRTRRQRENIAKKYKGLTGSDIIEEFRAGSINEVFPSEYLDRFWEDIVSDAREGIGNAIKAKKLLTDGRFDK